MTKGRIIKALSGFYYVQTDEGLIECRARGKFRLDGTSPLVGDMAEIELQNNGKGYVMGIEPRKNAFVRPAVANIDQLVIIASAVIPVTDPYLIDRVSVIAELKDVEVLICLNKADIDSANELYDIYTKAGFKVIRTSAATGLGTDELVDAIKGKINAFTGNSGVGKSSLLNRIEPGIDLKVNEVSDKLGRGKHTTRHVELISLSCGAYVADTPGFSSFDADQEDPILPERLPLGFIDFADHIDNCRFVNCSHTKEKGCAVLQALEDGLICPTRHESYVRLWEQAKLIKPWELKQNQ